MMVLSRTHGPNCVGLDTVQNTVRRQKEIQDIQSVLLVVGHQEHDRDVHAFNIKPI